MPKLEVSDKEMKAKCAQALEEKGNISHAAKLLGLSRPCFRKYAIQYGLWPRRKVKEAA